MRKETQVASLDFLGTGLEEVFGQDGVIGEINDVVLVDVGLGIDDWVFEEVLGQDGVIGDIDNVVAVDVGGAGGGG